MANRLLTGLDIMVELARLDDKTGAAAGYLVSDTVVLRKIDGKSVKYDTIDRLLSMEDFSSKFLKPLVCAPRKSDEIIGPTEIDDPEYGVACTCGGPHIFGSHFTNCAIALDAMNKAPVPKVPDWRDANKGVPGHVHVVYTPPNVVEDITRKRGSVYGPFLHNSIVAQAIKAAVRNIPDPDNEGLRWENLPLDVRESLDLIALKMSRIVTGDCEYLDNWDDIGGYAKIVADRIRAKGTEHVA